MTDASLISARQALRTLPAPEPSAGMAAYRAELARALAYDPRRQANYDLYLRQRRQSAKVEYLPVKLDFENVSRCNFRCSMCLVSQWPKGKRADDMDLDSFRRLIDEQYGLVEIKLQGIGEPLMQGDAFFDMIAYARTRHIWVRTTTNASLLHLRDNYRKLVDSDANEIQISIDGADAESFEAVRLGGRFDMVCKNSRLINDYCRERGVERTKMWTVVQERNWPQLRELVDLAGDLGFTNQVFSFDLHNWGREHGDNDLSRVAPEAIVDLADELVERGRRRGVRVAFWTILDKYSTRSVDTLCPWPFERAYVSSDLRVVPCCMIGNPDVSDLGDAAAGLAEIWRGEVYQAFRQAHLDGVIPAVCRSCYSS